MPGLPAQAVSQSPVISSQSEAELRMRLDQSEAAYLGAESEKEERRRH